MALIATTSVTEGCVRFFYRLAKIGLVKSFVKLNPLEFDKQRR
jgi:hypothetical protein